jgi:uncharacterized membrane protein YdjX (TVP38/TMEM64 family)
MNPKNPRRWLKAIPLAAFLICITAFFLVGRSLTYQELANWLPENQATAAALVILLYTAKSMTVFFPLLTLYLLSGILFPTPTAVLVNLLGLAACDTATYLLGRLLGSGELDRLRGKYVKLNLLESLRRKNGFQFAVLSRAVGLLPGDVVSLYFGCVKLSYPAYLAGSIVGLAPGMIATTILGGQISDPDSPGFWAAAASGFVVAAISFLACRRVVREERALKSDAGK